MKKIQKQMKKFIMVATLIVLLNASTVHAAIEVQHVPFITQAPTDNWDSKPWDNTCEEASIAMVDLYYDISTKNTASRETYISSIEDSVEDRKKIIEDTILMRERSVGHTEDEMPKQMVQLINNNYGWKARIIEKPEKKHIIDELDSGRPVIMPIHGQALFKHQFTYPGPDYHVVVIKGYDEFNDEFIVHDPGSNSGKNIRYESKEMLLSQDRLIKEGYIKNRQAVFTSPQMKVAEDQSNQFILQNNSGTHDLDDQTLIDVIKNIIEDIVENISSAVK